MVRHYGCEQVLTTPHHLCIQSGRLQGDEQRVDFPLEGWFDSTAELLADLVHSSLPGILLLDPSKSSCTQQDASEVSMAVHLRQTSIGKR